MTIRLARPALALAAVAALALATLAFSGAVPARAEGSSACKKWGTTSPDRLSNGQARKAVLCLINKQRSRAGLGKLDRHRKLQRAAQRHNSHMHGTGCFSHQCPGEASLDRRLKSSGYLSGGLSRWAYGENIAWGEAGYSTPRAMVRAWMAKRMPHSSVLTCFASQRLRVV